VLVCKCSKGVPLKFKSKVLIASASSLVIALAVFFSIQAVGEAQKSEEQARQDGANSLACETYMTFSFPNWKENMSWDEIVENAQSLEVLAVLGGSPEYMSMLNKINRSYKDVVESEAKVRAEVDDLILSMGALNLWCAPYLK